MNNALFVEKSPYYKIVAAIRERGGEERERERERDWKHMRV